MRAPRHRFSVLVASFGVLATLAAATARAQGPSIDEILSGIVRIKTFINPDGNTLKNLGREREGSGIVIDGNGLVLTIGYLMVEAYAAEVTAQDGHAIPATVVGYDHATGFGLLRAIMPLKARPLQFGKSADVKQGDPVLAASFGGAERALPAHVIALGEFAGSWEYLLDRAIFTAPPHPEWSGAALLNHAGGLIGVGSLILGDAAGSGQAGNMFVPIDLLRPILADLVADGRVGKGPPWLGMTTDEAHGRLLVTSVTTGGPAEKAGVRRGAVVLGVDGVAAKSLADFYRQVRALGSAGATVRLDLMQDDEKQRVEVKSGDRLEYLKLKSTF